MKIASLVAAASIALVAAPAAMAQAGHLDPTYGDGGASVHWTQPPGAGVRDLAIDSQGRSIALVSRRNSMNNWNPQWFITRRLASGALDPSFGTGGTAIISGLSQGTGGNTQWQHDAFQIAVQSDGKVLILGNVRLGNTAGTNGFMVARLNAIGTLDTSFGGSGFITSSTKEDYRPYALALSPQGQIVVLADTLGRNTHRDWVLVRHNSNGSRDNSFGNKGVVVDVITANQDTPGYQQLFVQADGRIVAGGFTVVTPFGSQSDTRLQYLIARYNANGTRDTSFGNSGLPGKTFFSLSGGYDQMAAIAPGPGGTVVAAGDLHPDPTCRSCRLWDMAVARFTSTGMLDSSFNGGFAYSPSPFQDAVTSVAVAPDGKVVVAGARAPGSGGPEDQYDLIVWRVNADGTMDTGFGPGGDGQSQTSIGAYSDGANAVKVDAAGRILAGGTVYSVMTPDTRDDVGAVWRLLAE
jgi:uncharacterized delta-60 repeat protein